MPILDQNSKLACLFGLVLGSWVGYRVRRSYCYPPREQFLDLYQQYIAR